MRIAWFTPFVKKSAIGKVGAQICEELAKEHNVEVWTAHTQDLIETSVPVRTIHVADAETELHGYDAIIYNMGNYTEFHKEIYDVSQRVPGIVILHDQNMFHFWKGYDTFPVDGQNRDAGLIEKYYGIPYEKAACITDRAGLELINNFDFIEPTVRGAKAIFTHSAFFSEKLRKIKNLPTSFAYLPCKAPTSVKADSELLDGILEKAHGEGRKILVSTGIVHPVKQIDKVAQMLLEDKELAEKLCYLVIGDYGGEYGEWLDKLSENELHGCLYMLGYQPYEVMWEALRAADLAVNLRYPNSEVCSLSLLEQMAAGKAVMTLDSGIFGEVPENTVMRIPWNNLMSEGRKRLHDLLDGKLDEQIGGRAAEFVASQCTTGTYCERLLKLIADLDENRAVCELQDRVILRTGQAMNRIRLNEAATPASYASVIDQLAGILGEQKRPLRNRTLGFWIGFPYAVPGLSREGVSRQMGHIGCNMLKYHSDVSIEVWCYSFNLQEAETMFASVRKEDRPRIVFVTEKNWAEVLGATQAERHAVGEISESKDNLVSAVRAVSGADVFMPIILYLDRIAEAGKRLVVPGYDMAVAEHYDEFVGKDTYYIARNLDYIWRVSNLVSHGADIFCNSNTVLMSEIMKYIPALKRENAHTIYAPPVVSAQGETELLPEAELRNRFSISGRYIFYPTQIRPYKSVDTLVKAFSILRNDYPDLKLVLTGNPSDDTRVNELLKDKEVQKRTLLLRNVSEPELYSLYAYSAAVAVTSIFEGGFPFQALEGIRMNAPIIIADIPMVKERIVSLGFDVKDSGVFLFKAQDAISLSEQLRIVLANRECAVAQQARFAEELFKYTWKEAVEKYYALFWPRNEEQ